MKIPRFVVNLEENFTDVVVRSVMPHPLMGEDHTTDDTVRVMSVDWLNEKKPIDALVTITRKTLKDIQAERKKASSAKAGDSLPSL